jgi:hypothetical protein
MQLYTSIIALFLLLFIQDIEGRVLAPVNQTSSIGNRLVKRKASGFHDCSEDERRALEAAFELTPAVVSWTEQKDPPHCECWPHGTDLEIV